MKILYHHRTLGDGAEGIHIAEMVNAFRNLGHEVLMAGPAANVRHDRADDRAAGRPGRVSVLKKIFRGPAYEALELGYNLAGFADLAGKIRAFRPDFLYDRYITYNYAVVAAGKAFGIPVILEVNAPLAYERAYESDERLFFRRLALVLEKKIISHADRTIVVSTPLKEYLVSTGVPPDKLVVLPNGVNTQKFNPGERSQRLMADLGLSPSDKIIGFTGILRPWHGIDLLIEAFGKVYVQHPNARLLLVGDGDIRSQMESLAERKGCKGLIITGRVPHHEVTSYIRLFDVAVSPKTTFYASPMKIPEYMAMGKPVVAPNTPNITDLLDDKINGRLFTPEDPDDLFRILDQFMRNSEQIRLMGVAALEKVRRKMSWQVNATAVERLVSWKCVRDFH